MARFDAHMLRASKATESVFGDVAEWQQSGQPLQSVTVIVTPDSRELGEAAAAIDQRIAFTVRKAAMRARPTNGEVVTVYGGHWPGTYTVDQVIDDTGSDYVVAVE